MLKVRISYQTTEEKQRIIAALEPLGIVKISKEQDKQNHKNVYIELEGLRHD